MVERPTGQAVRTAERRRTPDTRATLARCLEITLFTDPACPFAFSAEPVRWRLRWHYGDQLAWHVRMIVLTLEPGEAEKLAHGAPTLQRLYGMPIHPLPYPRPASSEPACRAVVAARVHAPGREEALLRRLRVRVMAGGLLDDPELIAGAAARYRPRPRRARELERDRRRRARAAGRHRRRARTRRAPPAPSTTSSAARGTSAATRPRATSCGEPTVAGASSSPASTPSRRTRPRSRTSRPSSSAGRSRRRSRSCSGGRGAARDGRGRRGDRARAAAGACGSQPGGAPDSLGADCYWTLEPPR